MTKEERSKPEIIRSVADGDKMQLSFVEDTEEQFRSRYAAFKSRASEINKADGWRHYRVVIMAEMKSILIVAERRPDDDGAGKD